MEQKLQKSCLATANFVPGLLPSIFIPLIGIIILVFIIVALGIFISIRQVKKVESNITKMAWAESKSQATQQILTQNAGALKLYKKRNGRYPESLDEVTKAGFTIFPTDLYLRPFFYEVSEDGQSYELRSLGTDGKYGTHDDIFPAGQ